MTTTPTFATESFYGSDKLVSDLAAIMRNHKAVGEDFPRSRPALLENLRTMQAALPAAIAEVQRALDEGES